jgi:putative resolvase
VEAAPEASGEAVVYARVSSADPRGDLDRQVARRVEGATERGLRVGWIVREGGSGLNGRRRRLRAAVIVVETRDRLARWGFERLEAALAAQGRRIVAVEDREVEDDLAQNVPEVLMSFCGRLHGRRSARRRARQALEAMGCG